MEPPYSPMKPVVTGEFHVDMLAASSSVSPLSDPLSSPALPSPSSEQLHEDLHTLSPHTSSGGEIDLLRFHSPLQTSTAAPSSSSTATTTSTTTSTNPSLIVTPPSSSSYPSTDSQATTTPTSVRLLENFRPSQHPPLPPPAIAILSPEETALHNHNSIAPQPLRDANGHIIITDMSTDPPTDLTPTATMVLNISSIGASEPATDLSSGSSLASLDGSNGGVSLSAPPPSSSATVKTVGRFSVVEQEGSPGSARTNNSTSSVSPDPNTPYEVRGNDCKWESMNPNDPHANSLQSIVEEGGKRKVGYKDSSTGGDDSDSDSSSDDSDDSTGSGSRSPKIPLSSLQMPLSPADSLKSLPQTQLRPNSIKATRSGRFSVVEFQETLTPTQSESSASGSSYQARLASPAVQAPLSRVQSSPAGPRSHQTIYESLSQLNADFADIMNENEVLNYESRLLLSHVFLLRTKLEAALMGQLAIDTAQEALRVTDITPLHCFKKLQQEQILLQQQAAMSSSSNHSSVSTSVTGVIQPNLSIAVSPSPDPVNTASFSNLPQSTRSAVGHTQNQPSANLPPTLHPSNSSPAAMTGSMGSPPPNPPNSTRDSTSKAQLHPSAQQLQHQQSGPPNSASMPNLTPLPAVVSKFFADQQAEQQQQNMLHSQASPISSAIEGDSVHEVNGAVNHGAAPTLPTSASTPALSSIAAHHAPTPHHHHGAAASGKHGNLKIDKVRNQPGSKDPLSPGSGKSTGKSSLQHSNSSHQLAPPSHTASSTGSQLGADRMRSSPAPSPSPRHSPTPRTPRAPKPSPHHAKVIHSHTHTHGHAHGAHAHHAHASHSHSTQPHGHHAHTHHGAHSHAKSPGGQLISPPESLERGHSHGDRSTPSGGSSPSVSGNHSHLKSPNTPNRPRKNTPTPPVPAHPTSNSHANKNAKPQPLPPTSTKANQSAAASTASTASSTPDILEQLANKCIENI